MIHAASAFAVAAREAKLESIVQMSQWTSNANHPALMTRQTSLVDQLFSMIPGVAHIIFNPGMFADNFLRVIDFASLLHFFPILMHEGKSAPISNEDMAKAASALLTDDPTKHAGKSYRPTGTTLLSSEEMAAIVSKVLGHKLLKVKLPYWMFMKVARQQGVDPYQAFMLTHYMQDHRQGAFELGGGVTHVMEELTGAPAESFETTARRYASLPYARKIVSNHLKAFVDFNLTPFYFGYNQNRYAKRMELPEIFNTEYCMQNKRWVTEHAALMKQSAIKDEISYLQTQ